MNDSINNIPFFLSEQGLARIIIHLTIVSCSTALFWTRTARIWSLQQKTLELLSFDTFIADGTVIKSSDLYQRKLNFTNRCI